MNHWISIHCWVSEPASISEWFELISVHHWVSPRPFFSVVSRAIAEWARVRLLSEPARVFQWRVWRPIADSLSEPAFFRVSLRPIAKGASARFSVESLETDFWRSQPAFFSGASPRYSDCWRFPFLSWVLDLGSNFRLVSWVSTFRLFIWQVFEI